MQTGESIFGEFPGFSRFDFPGNVKNVTVGHGGTAILITGSEKTAVVDCGMAYSAIRFIKNLKKELAGRDLDYVLISHTHYDHVGALPFVKQAWPGVVTIGAEHAKKVLDNPKAIKTINQLGENAGMLYEGAVNFIAPECGFTVDRTVADGDRIVLGKEEMVVLESKGHTDCSLAYVLEPTGIMFLSESTGVLEGPDSMHITILKSYSDSMAAVERGRKYGAKYLVSSHYGMMPEYYNETYWDSFISTADEYKEFLFELFARDLSDEEIMEKYTKMHWNDRRQQEQPKEAFILNAQNVIKVFYKEYENVYGKRGPGV
jgi:glyoxylase-like metal-dependent hydrolase (beta-lactamase superfamily II)